MNEQNRIKKYSAKQEVNESRFMPISSVEDLFEWNDMRCLTPLKSISLDCYTSAGGKRFTLRDSKNVPKTLVCHDMKGGYLDDSYILGSSNSEAYCFTQWNLIDTFIYFSHHFITIPPPSWIHAGHLHGVPVLGTLITEWEQGSSICQQIFSSKLAVDKLIRKMVDITRYYNFDGWLINIENPLEKGWIENVNLFLSELKKELRQLGQHQQLIWYDSVTKEGKLEWQNELNNNNRIFFEACDGIFLNYTWSLDNLALSALNAGDRIADVYVGIDVFGRNCHGGGGFNTSSALCVVRQHGLSAAVFAPGWVYECHPTDKFHELNTKFWSTLLSNLNMHDTTEFPVQTSFCPGYGLSRFHNGKVVGKDPWHNMSKQELQPFLAALNGLRGMDSSDMFEIFKLGSLNAFGMQTITTDDAYIGGGCLLLQSSQSATFPLFIFNIPLSCDLLITIIFKAYNPGLHLILSVNERNSMNSQ